MLRWQCRQRPMPAIAGRDAGSAELLARLHRPKLLCNWLQSNGKRLLPRKPADVERCLLSRRTATRRRRQEPMPADQDSLGSARRAFAAIPGAKRWGLGRPMLPGWPHPGWRRLLLCGRSSDVEWRLLSGRTEARPQEPQYLRADDAVRAARGDGQRCLLSPIKGLFGCVWRQAVLPSRRQSGDRPMRGG